MKKLKFRILTCILTFLLLSFFFPSFAQQVDNTLTLSNKLIKTDSRGEALGILGQLKDFYFKDNRYTEFVSLIKSFIGKNKTIEPLFNYYIALGRYSQLKYLEEAQDWDEYFSKGNDYRNEIVEKLEKAIESTGVDDIAHLWSYLLLWKFHRDLQDAFKDKALSELMDAALGYAKASKDASGIKRVADELLGDGQKGKARQLYKIYVDSLISSGADDEKIKEAAFGFYQESNLELAEVLYDVYIERVTRDYPKEKIIPILIEIARYFAYTDVKAGDPEYAEKIFQKIQDLGGKTSFNEDLMYMRAYNLEKQKEYSLAKDIYEDLIQYYPQSAYSDEATFKIAIIYAYILKDLSKAKEYFERLSKKEVVSPEVVSSIYQLGLLSQWKGDFVKAREYYDNVIDKTKDETNEIAALARTRIQEIVEEKPIEYNLLMFLDASLKESPALLEGVKVDLRCSPYKAAKAKDIHITSTAYAGESGCMQVELSYLWSGDLGSAKPSNEQTTFLTNYTSAGIKVINLVVLSPSGIVDRSLDFLSID